MKGGQHGGKRFLLLPDKQSWFGLRLHSPQIRHFDKMQCCAAFTYIETPCGRCRAAAASHMYRQSDTGAAHGTTRLDATQWVLFC